MDTSGERILRFVIPNVLVEHPELVWSMMDQVIGINVREKAHSFWHETEDDNALSTTERTIRYAQIQGMLDWADEIDPTNKPMTDWCLEHFRWKFPTNGE